MNKYEPEHSIHDLRYAPASCVSIGIVALAGLAVLVFLIWIIL